MTSRADIAQVPFGNNQYQQVWAGIPGDAGKILLWNQDLNNNVYVGFRTSIAIGGLNTIPIPPNGMVTLGTDRTIYAIAPQGTANLISVPGGGSFFRGLTQANGQLVLPAIQSPNFLTGVSGWVIRKDGSAEFNNIVIRNGQIVSGTALYYSGTGLPAANTLVASISAAAGTDTPNNAYLAGVTQYSAVGGGYEAINFNSGLLSIYTAVTEAGPWTQQSTFQFDNANLLTRIFGGANGGEIVLGGIPTTPPTTIGYTSISAL